MSNRTFMISLFIFLSIAISAIIVHAQDDAATEDVEAGVKSHGVVHNIAEDRQIERIGGIYQPEGLDKYMKRKFDAMSQKIGELENKVDQLTEEVKRFSGNPRGFATTGALVSKQGGS